MRKLLFTIFAAIALKSNAQQLVRATDVNMVTTAGTKIVINGGISFIGTALLKSTDDSIYLYKTTAGSPEGWLDSTTNLTGAMDVTSTGSVFFRGSFLQSFYGKTKFYNLFIRNTIGDTLLSSCEVRGNLHLDTGFVFTRSGYGNDSLLVSNGASAAITSTSSYSKSWVRGRLSRLSNLAGAANEYLFPIGKTDSLYAPIKLDKFNTNPNIYTAEYFPTTPFNSLNVNNPPVDHVSQLEYWEITGVTATGPNSETKVSLSWRTFSRVSTIASTRDSLIVSQYVDGGAGYKWDKTGTVPALHTKTDLPDETFGYIKHIDYMGGYSFADRRFTLGTMSRYNALPAKLLYFTALADGNKVRLNWNVANEETTLYYDVEKSLTGTSFSHLLTVNSLQRPASQYIDYDYSPATGWNFYRIKIVDKSGSFTYSPVRAVKFVKGQEDVQIFPNPATTVLNIQLPSSYAGKVNLQVYAADGKYISSMKPTVNTIQLNVLPLPAGTYILKMVRDNGDISTYRFVKQ